MHRLVRVRFRMLAALLLPLILLAACGSSSSSSSATSGASGGSVAAAAGSSSGGGSASGSDPVVLQLADPGNQGPLAYAKKTGALAQALSKVNAKVSWGGSYASFTATTYAIRAGQVNLTGGAISPVLGYLATSNDLQIFGFEPRSTQPDTDSGLVVLKNSSIKSVKDLEGKTVAVNQAGHGQYLLFLALEQAGVPVNSVKQVFLNPTQASAALASGKVDAEFAIVNAYPAALQAGARVIVDASSLPSQDLTIVAAKRTLLDQRPEVIQAYLNEYNQLIALGNKNPALFQNVFLTKGPTATSGAVLKEQTTQTADAQPFHTAQASDLAAVKSVSDEFVKYGVLKQGIDPNTAVFNLATAK